jgi:hypothetical protein
MDDDRPWLGEEPSARPDLRFAPFGTAVGAFLAVAGPICFVGIAREGGTNVTLVGLGLVAGLLLAVVVGLALDARGGREPRIRGRL